MSDTDDTQDQDQQDQDQQVDQGDSDTGAEEVDHRAEAEKWKALARKHEGQSKTNATAAAELQKLKDADKTETQRAADKALKAEQRATAAEATSLRLEVALDKAPDGMSIAQVRKLAKRLAGGTREELEADAVELFGDFAPSDGDESDKDARRRPRERLKSGNNPSGQPEESDPKKLAEAVPRRW